MAREQTIQRHDRRVLLEGGRERGRCVRPGQRADIVGLVVVSKDLEGKVQVDEEDHAVRKGAAALGGAGFVVGLFAPPLLAATAIGAALGAGVGKAVQGKVTAGIEEQARTRSRSAAPA